MRITSAIATAVAFLAMTTCEVFAQAPASAPLASSLSPGIAIDSNNVASFSQYLPAAADAAVRHGLKIKVVPTKRLDWSTGFTQATEKYSSQVGLDKDDFITNYVAGAPFPTVD